MKYSFYVKKCTNDLEMTTFVRRVHFSAAQTYVQPQLSKEENQKIYGSFFKPKGLGHNFQLEAYFSGEVDPQTGMIVNLMDVDSWLKELLIPLDHHYLNQDIEFFKSHVPTAENIARYCFETLQKLMQTRGTRVRPFSGPSAGSVTLLKVRLFEGDSLAVDYSDQPLQND
jgi:6-pyruvoyltetrahydropterin/6-carboxytetrahydropterin synthase